MAVLKIMGVLLTVLLFRNVLFNDYRNQELSYLKRSGVKPDDIARYVPPTARERTALAKSKLGEMDRLRADVDRLTLQVEELRSVVGVKLPGGDEATKTAAAAAAAVVPTGGAEAKRTGPESESPKGDPSVDKPAIASQKKKVRNKHPKAKAETLATGKDLTEG